MFHSPSGSGRSFCTAFTDLRRLPRGFWFCIGAFVVDSSAYFGVLTLMTTYLSGDLGWGDARAGITVSVFTMLVTLFMLGVGSVAESFGLRRAILFGLLVATVGRVLYSLAPSLHHGLGVVFLILGALGVVAAAEAILQPVCYSGVKQYTDAKTSSMGYGLIYAVMNLGIVGIAALSSWARPAVNDLQKGLTGRHAGEAVLQPLAGATGSGVQAVNWLCVGITALTFVGFALLMTRRVEAAKLRPDLPAPNPAGPGIPFAARLGRYFTEGPFRNRRFLFFIFMLLPVRTIFAHQWLTMPSYILRAYDQGVADHMEWLVNWINPMIIFVGVPITTALTRHINVYKMMVIGSFVSAVPTFLLCFGPNLSLLITNFVLYSIGEALWSARFLEYASELAPPGRIAQYMGLAQIPWLLAKGTTGFYSGFMLAKFCPADTPAAQLHTGTMWFIYGCIALASPLGLWLARHWVMAGLQTKPANAATPDQSAGDATPA